jgi:hypothetical protein
MPILAFGEFKARSADETGFVRGQAMTFTYAPWYLALWFGIAATFGVLARIFWITRRSYAKGRYLVIVPGVAGVAIAVFVEWSTVTWLLPPALETFTVTFVLWRLLRIRRRVPAALLAVFAGLAVSAAHIAIDAWGSAYWHYYIYYFLAPAGMALAPVAGIRLFLRDRVTWKRILAGIALGVLFALPLYLFFVAQYSMSAFGNSWELITAAFGMGIDPFALGHSWSLVFLPFGAAGFLFVAFTCWNAWARDVATGNMFRNSTPGD